MRVHRDPVWKPERAASINTRDETALIGTSGTDAERFFIGVRLMITCDPTDARLKLVDDAEPAGMAEAYLVMDEEERRKAFTRPYRHTYRHVTCGKLTKMGHEMAETFAVCPTFYDRTYCAECCMDRSLAEFTWEDGTVVGS